MATTTDPTPRPVTELDPARADLAERALEVLLDAALDPIVDMVLVARDGAYEAITPDGRQRFRRTGPGATGYEVIATEGVDPLADQSTDRFAQIGRAHV